MSLSQTARCLLPFVVALAPAWGQAPGSDQGLTRAALIKALAADHVFVPGRQILRVVHLCTLAVGGAREPVADIIEQVPGAQVPRGMRRVVLLSPALTVIRELRYDPPAVPLFCAGNVLYFSAPIRVDNVDPAGNAITFELDGSQAVAGEVDPNRLPAPTAAVIR